MKRTITYFFVALFLSISACNSDKVIPELEGFIGFWFWAGDYAPLEFTKIGRKELLITSAEKGGLDDFLDPDLDYELDSMFVYHLQGNTLESDTIFDEYWSYNFWSNDSIFYRSKFLATWQINEDGQTIVVTSKYWDSRDFEPYEFDSEVNTASRTP